MATSADSLFHGLGLLASLGCGLNGGFFFAFSVVVMRALGGEGGGWGGRGAEGRGRRREERWGEGGGRFGVRRGGAGTRVS